MLDKLGKVLGDYLRIKLGQELRDQGHNLTGDLITSLEYRVRTTVGGIIVEFLSNNYGAYLNTGIPAYRIPYTPGGRRRGGTSMYIQGLIRYVERRIGLRGREAVGVAFAIARAHKREGMPTQASHRFSKNGRRTGWIDAVLKGEEKEIDRQVREFVGRELDVLFSNFFKQATA
jgi:hypothetical protein